MMMILVLHVAETAPFACDRSEQVSFVELNVLDGVAKADFVSASASNNVTANLDDREFVNQLLGVCHVSLC